jgi:hypothetical protein
MNIYILFNRLLFILSFQYLGYVSNLFKLLQVSQRSVIIFCSNLWELNSQFLSICRLNLDISASLPTQEFHLGLHFTDSEPFDLLCFVFFLQLRLVWLRLISKLGAVQ